MQTRKLRGRTWKVLADSNW